ncbi:acyl-phosphate glycerol 3-phosphate acyltransferase [Achromatium sp. WMS3]|nr:acyl-phosphate glycerol 3-phosphate acyltransferase [Achromatium sp. WMS3]
MFQDILYIIAAYMLGSLSSGIIVCKLMGLPDPRTQGSNNPGATNVLRFGNKLAAAITLLGDSLKGLIPMLLAHTIIAAQPMLLALIGIGAFLGHLYPIWFRFQGGKGVATALGVQIGLYWMFGSIIAILWLVTAKITKTSSLAALASMALAPVVLWLTWPVPELLIMQLIISVLLFWRHKDNIQRLLAGKEGQIQANNNQ